MYPIEFFWRAARQYPERAAVIAPEGNLTFRALAERVVARAEAIVAFEPTLGSRVAIGANNSAEHLISLLAVLAAGKVWIPLNPRNADPELARQIDFLRPALILADEHVAPRIPSARLFTDLPAKSAPLPMGPSPASVAVPLHHTQAIKLTGGSTGMPKGVEQPLRAWNTNIVTQISMLGLRPDDRYLVTSPLTHGTSTYMLPVLGSGGALVFPESSKPAGLLDAGARHDATLFFAPPTLIFALVEEQQKSARALKLRHLIYGGAPMRAAKIVEAQECFGNVICTSYGQTEAPQVIAFLPPAEMAGERLASIGRATLLTQIAIIDADGKAVATGQEGEIAVRGDLVMTGYVNNPDETARVLQDGWLRTGDAGILDERGYVYLRDRLRDVIITGGFNVYPGDVEAVIAKIPAVADASVVGIPDAKWGEAVHVAVEVRAGHTLDADALKHTVKETLGPVMAPKHVHLFTTLPRTAVGKISKPAIRDEIARRAKDGERG